MAVAVLRPLILSRLLAPDDFGVVALALFVVSGAQALTELGLNFALIQKETASTEEYDTVWTVSALRGAILAALVAFSASLSGRVFHDQRVAQSTLPLALIPLLSGLTNPYYAIGLQRQLSFGKVAAGQLLLVTSDLTVSAALAIATHSFWSLVAGQLASYSILLGYSYLIVAPRPRPLVRGSCARPLVRYGRHILTGTVLYFLYGQFDNAVVGHQLGVTELGYYKMAYGLAFLPLCGLTAINNTVIFPTLARNAGGHDARLSTFLRIFRVTTTSVALLSVFLITVPREIVAVLLGPRWLPASAALPVLGGAALFRAATEAVVPYFCAAGQPQRSVYALLAQLLPFCGLIVPLTARFGFLGTSWAVLLSYAAGFCADLLLLRHEVLDGETASKPLGMAVVWIVLISAAAVGCGSCVSVLHPLLTPPMRLMTAGSVAGMVYVGLILLRDRKIARELKSLIAAGWPAKTSLAPGPPGSALDRTLPQ